MLNQEQSEFFWEHGYLHIPEVFTVEETDKLSSELDWLIEEWANETLGWSGPWRKEYMDEETEKKSKLIAMHDLYFYSEAWMKAVTNPRLCSAMAGLLGPNVELHHSTMHVKPTQTGQPFPMHQDWQYFPTINDTMIAGVVHVSEATDEMGCFRVYPGSHKELGRCEGMMGSGQNAEVHKLYPIDKATVLQAESGDVVFFHYFTLHGSMPNSSLKTRKTVLVQLYAGNDKVEDGNGHTDVRLVLRGWNHMVTRSIAGSV